MGGRVELLAAAALFVAAGVLVSGWLEGRLALPVAVVLAAAGLATGLPSVGQRRAAGLAVAGGLLVGAGFFGTFGAGMVGGVLFGESGYVDGAGLSDYRVVYGSTYLALAAVSAAVALALLRVRRPPAP